MAFQYLPIYVGDYLRDTQHLTTEQHGAYLLLLLSAWQRGSIPNDQGKLARIARVSPKRWKAVWPELAEFFCDGGPGLLINQRLNCERQKVLRITQYRKHSGSLGGFAKSLNNKTTGLANAKQRLCNHNHKENLSIISAKGSVDKPISKETRERVANGFGSLLKTMKSGRSANALPKRPIGSAH